MLEADSVVKEFHRGGVSVRVLDGVSVGVAAGEAVGIVGPSGAGKSTLVQLLGALDRPSSGSVRVEGRDTAAMADGDLTILRRRRIGFVFQFFNLLPTLSAAENVAVPVLLDGVPMRRATTRALELLGLVGLADRADHRPAELSGGELQRVAIARALVADPALVLADEPTGNLDSGTGATVLEVLRSTTVDAGRTLVMVTHDPMVASAADRVIELHDGRVVSGE